MAPTSKDDEKHEELSDPEEVRRVKKSVSKQLDKVMSHGHGDVNISVATLPKARRAQRVVVRAALTEVFSVHTPAVEFIGRRVAGEQKQVSAPDPQEESEPIKQA